MPTPPRLSSAPRGSPSFGTTPAAAYTCRRLLSRASQSPRLAVPDVRQAAIASATPGGVRAGYTGPSPATTSTGDPSNGTVVFAFGTERGVVGRACPAVAVCYLGGVHGDKGRPPLLVTSWDETDHGELLCDLGPRPRAAPGLRASTRTGETAAARHTRARCESLASAAAEIIEKPKRRSVVEATNIEG
ncbi:hypothetical protein PSPO01_03461 [Paraphaeosphaeria sporulosa]